MSAIPVIELPLDPEYITEAGAYLAGYNWGQHVRSLKDAQQMFPGTSALHKNFYQGVEDGYNDTWVAMAHEMKITKNLGVRDPGNKTLR